MFPWKPWVRPTSSLYLWSVLRNRCSSPRPGRRGTDAGSPVHPPPERARVGVQRRCCFPGRGRGQTSGRGLPCHVCSCRNMCACMHTRTHALLVEVGQDERIRFSFCPRSWRHGEQEAPSWSPRRQLGVRWPGARGALGARTQAAPPPSSAFPGAVPKSHVFCVCLCSLFPWGPDGKPHEDDFIYFKLVELEFLPLI